MRNLKIVGFEDTKPDEQNDNLPFTSTTWDAATDSVICASGPTPSNPTIRLSRKHYGDHTHKTTSLIASWDAPCPLPDLESDAVLSVQFFAETSTTCLVLAGGDLLLVREDPRADEEAIEIVGSIDVGILAATWSPDEELLAVVTRRSTLILMSRDLEPVTEIAFSEDDLKLSKHVSVGWGKKETQFHGKRAKALRDPTMPETVDEGRPSTQEQGDVTITWRGDGAFLAMNSNLSSPRRVIRVFSREGALESVSEPVDGLESALSWRPHGNLIAGVKRSEASESQSRLEIVFFERNGLRHGEFDLRLDMEQMNSWAKSVKVFWNNDSSILAVQYTDRIQFWTMGNYHYYLKQEVLLSSCSSFRWHPENPLRYTACGDRIVHTVGFVSMVDRGSTIRPFDYGMVGVIDGKQLKITPLKHVGIPPPMAFVELEADSNIVAVAFSRTCQRLAYITTEHLYLVVWEMQTASPKSPELRHTSKISKRKVNLPTIDGHLPGFTQIKIQDDDTVYLFAPSRVNSTALLATAVCRKFTWVNTLQNGPEAVFSEIPVPSQTQNIFVDVSQEEFLFQSEGLLHACNELEPSKDLVTEELYGDEPRTAIFRSSRSGSLQRISLSSKGKLSHQSHTLVQDCTSFIVTDTFLIFTTSRNLLKFVHLHDGIQLEVPGDTPEVDERCRAIERGAQIVTVSPSIYAVILQMPRGNLETIYPRVLVVTGIREHIRNHDYRSAFLACRNHQVDLNILYDYLPGQFFAHIDTFIDQLKKPSRLDEFISKLKDEDVTQTLYRDTLQSTSPHKDDNVHAAQVNGIHPTLGSIPKDDKVNRICNALISALRTRPSSYLQNIITAHVCKRPPDLGAALTLVSSLRQISTEDADLAVSHLCFLSDSNRLFDAALALYDLELTLLVAQNAQKDPREYMPFLQSLQAMPSLRRQYTIDNHLRNYAKALSSLHILEAHEEVEAYTIKHSLYSEALKLYRYSPSHHAIISRRYAEYLSETKSQHAPAAALYEALEDYSLAYPLYAVAHQWREALTCASLAGLESDKILALAKSLATTCADESRDYRSAATILIDYVSDIPAAARALCKGSYFAEAMRLLSHPSHNLSAEIPTIINPALTEKFGEIVELIANCKSQLASQVPRIEELRKKKAEDPLAFYGGDPGTAGLEGGGGGADIPDNVSLAATDTSTVGGQSLFTRYGSNASKFGGTVASNVSRKTSKTKRREERKRARGKKGSVYEEEYLVASVARLIERVNGTHDEVNRLISALVRRGLSEQAEKVGEVMVEIEEFCRDAKGRVWGLGDEVEMENLVGGERPSGADGVYWDSQKQMENGEGIPHKKEVPVVKAWKSTVVL